MTENVTIKVVIDAAIAAPCSLGGRGQTSRGHWITGVTSIHLAFLRLCVELSALPLQVDTPTHHHADEFSQIVREQRGRATLLKRAIQRAAEQKEHGRSRLRPPGRCDAEGEHEATRGPSRVHAAVRAEHRRMASLRRRPRAMDERAAPAPVGLTVRVTEQRARRSLQGRWAPLPLSRPPLRRARRVRARARHVRAHPNRPAPARDGA